MNENIERRFTAGSVAVRAENAEKAQTIGGIAAVIGRASPDLGGFVETIDPGAFDGADISDVVGLFNHDRNLLLGRTSSGTVRLEITDDGLEYEVDLPDTSYARDLRASMERGDVTQSSFAFTTADDEWEERDGVLNRTIKKFARIYDVSPVTEPAYPQTSVALRSLEHWKTQHKAPDGAGFLRLARAQLELRERL